MLFCHETASPLVDVNTARVIERVFGRRRLADIRYDDYLQTLAAELVHCHRPEAVNWAMLDLAALVCKPKNPDCFRCPLVGMCRFFRTVVPRRAA
jgi:A/G-specific adenine glycosylase